MPSSKEPDKKQAPDAPPEAKDLAAPRPRPLPLSTEKPGAQSAPPPKGRPLPRTIERRGL